MIEELEPPVVTSAMVDPETLVMRGEPSKVVRFRKAAIVGIALIGSSAVVAAAWIGLSPATLRVVAQGKDQILPTSQAPDELANAPKSYGDMPTLGAPLPGDLGRPILEHQRAMVAQPSVVTDNDQVKEAERQKAAAELKAARESGVMVQRTTSATGSPVSDTSSTVASSETGQGGSSSRATTDAERDPNGQQRKIDFARAEDGEADINPHRLAPPPSPYTLSAGTIIAASLITGLNSDLPGFVTAQVTQNAYDTATGKILLVPQGARLLGRYDSMVAFGQSRALVVWDRLLLPDGSSIRIDNAPATDAGGYAGLAGKLDRHRWRTLKGVGLSTLLGLGSELSLGNDDGDIVSALRRSAQQSGTRAGDQLVGRSLLIQPTIRVQPGSPLRVVVHKDIVLRPWREG